MDRAKEHIMYRCFFIGISLLPIFSMSCLISFFGVFIDRRICELISPFTSILNLVLSLAATVLVLAFMVAIKFKSGEYNQDVVKVVSCDNKNTQAFTFFLTVTIPMISIGTLGGWAGFFCFWISSILIVRLLWKSDIWFANPMLVLFGFNLYEVNLEHIEEKQFIVTKKGLRAGDSIGLVLIAPPVFYS